NTIEYVEGDIIVENGGSLVINSSVVHFSPKGRIIVHPGGDLLISSSTLTHLPDPCHNYMWQGIEIHGDQNLLSSDPVQGMLRISNSVIEYAHIGILLGARNSDAVCNFDPVISLNNFDLSLSGGVVRFMGSTNPDVTFIKNGIDIQFLPKINPDASFNLIANGLFKGRDNNNYLLNDEHYSTLYANPYPNSLNPWAAQANEYRVSHSGIILSGQNFELTNPVNHCEFSIKWFGIQSLAGRFVMTNSSFEHVRYCVRIDEFTPNINAHIIDNCNFTDITGVINLPGYGIQISGGNGDLVQNCTFENTDINVDRYRQGINLTATSGFDIIENTFIFNKNGITAKDAVNGWIGAGNPDWHGNWFYDCETGIATLGNNTSLALKCNDHLQSSIYSYFKSWDNIIGDLADQGTINGQPNGPAGNSFNNPFQKWLDSPSAYPYQYVYHGDDDFMGNIYQPVPLTGSIDAIFSGISYTTNQQSCQVSLPVPQVLPAFSYNVYPFSALDSLRVVKANFQALLQDILDNLDQGETTLLLSAILSYSPGTLKNLLISHSPLSDTIIYSLMTENTLSPGDFKNVMEYNLPVSRDMTGDFISYITNLPKGIKSQLIALQRYNPSHSTATKYTREIDRLETTYLKLLNDIVGTLTDTINNRKNDAIQLLENDNSAYSKQILFGTYLETGNYSSAQQKLNELQGTSTDNDDFVALNQIVLSYYILGKTIFEIDSSDLAFVYDIAVKCPENPAIYSARTIVYLVTGEEISGCPYFVPGKSLLISQAELHRPQGMEEKDQLGKNYPDPFSLQTRIPYVINGENPGKLIIKDMLGRVVDNIEVTKGKGEVVIDNKNWPDGVYIYTLYVSDRLIGSDKMILKK
ncbi:MAG: T9SS type A sorting domain-containing protein, partial [Bacteroidota bacterium]